MNLKYQLKHYLNEQKISASELSRRTGISKQSISDWLAGVHPRDLSNLKRVADELGVSVDNLLFGQGTMVKLEGIPLDNDQGWVSGVFEVKFRRMRS